MAEGRIPTRVPRPHILGGQGSGRPCAICGEVMWATQLETEAHVATDGGVEIFHLHALCEAAWRLELLGPSEETP
jgi:hypothetical protein